MIHTAGPYLGGSPEVLAAAIAAKVPCYVDVADPVEYLDAARAMSQEAKSANTMALVSAGAFPGKTNPPAAEPHCCLRVAPKPWKLVG